MNPCTPKKDVLLSTLLPYDLATRKNGQLIASLHEYELLVIAAEHALVAAAMGHFEKFDALVGENMCQIRAVKIAAIMQTLQKSNRLQELQALRNTLPVLRDTLKKSPRGGLDALLKEQRLEIRCTSDEVFLVQAYLLTQSKEVKAPKSDMPLLAHEVTVPKKLKRLSQVTGSFAEALIKKTRRDLSSASVNFVQACMDSPIPDPVEYKGCYSLPFFQTNAALIQYAAQEKIPITIEVDQVSLGSQQKTTGYRIPFIPTEEGYQYAPGRSSDRPEIIFKGFMQTSKRRERVEVVRAITAYGPEDLFLFNSATHRQSVDPSKETEVSQHPLFSIYREVGEKAGCSLDNPSLFFIHHVFCNSIRRQEDLHQEKMRHQIKQELSIHPHVQGGL